MKHMDIDCYERGCACVSSSRVAGENIEVVEVVSLRELSDEEIMEIAQKSLLTAWVAINPMFDVDRQKETAKQRMVDFARAILKKARGE